VSVSNKKLSEVVKPFIADLKPYEPGKPIEELERELGISGSVKLASNENPLGPSPKAVEALSGCVAGVHRYPDGGSFALKKALADKFELTEQQVVLGAGSDEILELLAKCFLGEGDEVIFAWPSFAMYPIVAKGVGATPVAIPLTEDFEHDLRAMAAAISDATRMIFLCNPNNPTGTSMGAQALDDFMQQVPDGIVVAIDEAYFEYARRGDFPDALAWVRKRPGTLVMRTFSKIYGLAGLRVGYGLTDMETAGYIERARHPFNVNLPAQVAALAALSDEAHVEASRKMNNEGIAYFEKELSELGLRCWPTDANFILIQVGVADCYDQLLRQGVIVRPMDGFGLSGFIRITIGSPIENKTAMKALRKVLEAAA